MRSDDSSPAADAPAGLDRRTALRLGAWSVPVIAAAVASPWAAATTGACLPGLVGGDVRVNGGTQEPPSGEQIHLGSNDGASVSFTFTLTNAGGGTANLPRVRLSFYVEETFPWFHWPSPPVISASDGSTWSVDSAADTLMCTVGSIPPGATVSLTVTGLMIRDLAEELGGGYWHVLASPTAEDCNGVSHGGIGDTVGQWEWVKP